MRRSCHSAPERTLQSSSKPERAQQSQFHIHFSWMYSVSVTCHPGHSVSKYINIDISLGQQSTGTFVTKHLGVVLDFLRTSGFLFL